MGRKVVSGIVLTLLLLFSVSSFFEVENQVGALTLFSDDFSSLSGWHVVDGDWKVSGGVLEGASVNGEGLIWAGDITWTHYRVTANVRIVDFGDDPGFFEASLVVRYVDSINFYWLGLGCWGHKYSISKVVGGEYRELAFSGVASELEQGRWYIISAVAIDNTLQLFVDGVKVLEVLTGSNEKGAVGLRTWDNTMQTNQLVVQSMEGWIQTYGPGGMEIINVASAVFQTGDGGYVLAGSSNIFTALFVRTDSVGNKLWDKTWDFRFHSMVQTNDGGYALLGSNRLPDGGSSIELIKTDSNVNQLWNKTVGYEMADGGGSLYCLIQASDGGYVLSGNSTKGLVLLVKTDAAGNIQWSKDLGNTPGKVSSIIQTSEGGYALACVYYGRDGDFWLRKTDAAGNEIWNKTYGGTGGDIVNSIVQTSYGGYALAGYTYSYGAGSNDIWLVRTDAVGNELWNRTYGGEFMDVAYSVVQTSDGGYALAGYTYSFGIAEDIWFVRTDSTGNKLWDNVYALDRFEEANCMIQTSDGGYALAGGSHVTHETIYILVKVPADEPPYTFHDYDGSRHTTEFTIKLSSVDDFTSVSQTYYRINDGATQTIRFNGQPVIDKDGIDNKLEYWSVDSLGHEELPHKILTGIELDKTAPIGSILINNGDASTTSTSVTLSLTYTDATSGVAQVRYSNDGMWDTETWEAPVATKSWTLTSGEETKTVYYQIRDNVNLQSITFSDSIILESPSPTPTPTASPTPTPSSSPSPTPTTSPTPSPSPSPTPSPSPAPTPTPSPTAEPTPTPAPAATPTPSPVETATPNPSPTASPSETLEPVYSPAPLTQDPILYVFIGITIILLVGILAVLLWKK